MGLRSLDDILWRASKFCENGWDGGHGVRRVDGAFLYGSLDAVDQGVERLVDGHVLDEAPVPSESVSNTLLTRRPHL